MHGTFFGWWLCDSFTRGISCAMGQDSIREKNGCVSLCAVPLFECPGTAAVPHLKDFRITGILCLSTYFLTNLLFILDFNRLWLINYVVWFFRI